MDAKSKVFMRWGVEANDIYKQEGANHRSSR